MGSDHHPPGDLVGDLDPVVAPDEVQAEVDPRRGASRREHVALVDVEHVVPHPHVRVAARQQVGVPPVRRCLASVEQPGRCQHERARADGDDARPVRVGLSERIGDPLGGRPVGVGAPGHDHRVGLREQLEPVGHHDAEPSDRVERARVLRAEREPVPEVDVQLGSRNAERLHRDTELERREAARREGGNAMRATGAPTDDRHGRIVAMGVMQDSGVCPVNEASLSHA